jgi:ribosomal protein S18 acetylase RimI-like enzyme
MAPVAADAFSLRRARPAEAVLVAALFRTSIPAPLQSYAPAGQSGFACYLRDAMRERDVPRRPARFTVAVRRQLPQQTRVAGAAEWRVQDDGGLLLNHISVHPSARGQGLGRALVRRGVRAALQQAPGASGSSSSQKQPPVAAGGPVRLDVFAGEERARDWYERLGFERKSTRAWCTCALPPSCSTAPAYALSGLHDAAERHRRWGFSSFTLRRPGRCYEVGRLGRALFRTTAPALLHDSSALKALALLPPTRRRLLVLGPARQAERAARRRPDSRLLGRSLRLEAPAARVLRRLSAPSS